MGISPNMYCPGIKPRIALLENPRISVTSFIIRLGFNVTLTYQIVLYRDSEITENMINEKKKQENRNDRIDSDNQT